MNQQIVKKVRKEIRHQYWKYFSRKPRFVPYFIWEFFMKRAFFSFYPRRK